MQYFYCTLPLLELNPSLLQRQRHRMGTVPGIHFPENAMGENSIFEDYFDSFTRLQSTLNDKRTGCN
jgi:hypothetical protein